MNKALILVIIAEIWMTIGQICFKKSANRFNIKKTPDPTLWLGGASMLVGLLFWFAALSSGELSLVYLLGSIQYILALFGAHFFLQEKINTTKVIGTLLIMLGIILTAIS